MPDRFVGRTAIVTGGASGIGAGIAARLAAEGARVSLWDRDAGALQNADAPHKVALDVTDADAVHRAAEATAAMLGKIDILVASAGITGPNHPTWEYPVFEWDRVIDVNLKGVFYCNRAVVPFMLRNGYGRIVNIASIAGKEGNPNASAYSASKAGVIGLTRHLATYWAERAVRVNTLTPGGVSSGQNNEFSRRYSARIPLGRMAEADDLVGAAVFLASDASRYVTGQNLVVDGGLSAW